VAERFDVQGADRLQKKLAALGEAASGRVIRSAVGYALTPVLKAARQGAPKGSRPHKTYKGRTVAPGFLSRNLKKKARLSRDKSVAYGSIFATGEAFYGRFSEFGQDGERKQAQHPFLGPAFKSNRQVMVTRYKLKLRQRIRIEAAK